MSNTFGWLTAGIPRHTCVTKTWCLEWRMEPYITRSGDRIKHDPFPLNPRIPWIPSHEEDYFLQRRRGFGIFHSGVHCSVSHLPGVDLYFVLGGRWISSRKMWEDEVLLEWFWAHSIDTLFKKLRNRFEWRDLETYFNRNKGPKSLLFVSVSY